MTGAEIRTMRKLAGLTQVQLGSALGVSANTVARWEREERNVEHPKMLRLALQQIVDTSGDQS